MNLRFEPNFDEDVIDEDGDLVVGVEGESSFRVVAQCVSPDDAKAIIDALANLGASEARCEQLRGERDAAEKANDQVRDLCKRAGVHHPDVILAQRDALVRDCDVLRRAKNEAEWQLCRIAEVTDDATAAPSSDRTVAGACLAMIAELRAERDAAVRERDEAREKLAPYCEHSPHCILNSFDMFDPGPPRRWKYGGKWVSSMPACTCGLDAAIGGQA